jgi:hypothetical protein
MKKTQYGNDFNSFHLFFCLLIQKHHYYKIIPYCSKKAKLAMADQQKCGTWNVSFALVHKRTKPREYYSWYKKSNTFLKLIKQN